MKLSFQKAFFSLAFVTLIIVFMVVAKQILIPLGIALLLAFILYPVYKKITSWGVGNSISAFLSILLLIVILGGGLTFFSAEIMSLSDEVSNFGEKLTKLFTDVVVFVNQNVSIFGDLEKDELIKEAKKGIKESAASLLGGTFSSTANFFTGLITTFIYLFLFLIYEMGLVRAFLKFSPKENKEQFFDMLKQIQQVGQKYLSGMMILIVILGTVNSVGLWIIGIDSPFLFGFLAATLSIIPYIGTTLGATIPVLYAFMSHDSLLIPLAVAILFWVVQLIESNFLSPKIVGNSVNVNAFAAILSLIIGAAIWGVAGMVLFLPFAAMLKVICEHYDSLKPVALLIGNSNFQEGDSAQKSMLDKLKEKFRKK